MISATKENRSSLINLILLKNLKVRNTMYTIGVDLGGTNIAIGLCDEDLKILDKGSVPTKASREPELIIKDMAELAKTIIERNGLKLSDIEYVGIAAPGTVNAKTGIVEYANNLPFLLLLL